MVVGTLQDIAYQFVFKECHGKFHQFDQVIRNERNVYAHGNVH